MWNVPSRLTTERAKRSRWPDFPVSPAEAHDRLAGTVRFLGGYRGEYKTAQIADRIQAAVPRLLAEIEPDDLTCLPPCMSGCRKPPPVGPHRHGAHPNFRHADPSSDRLISRSVLRHTPTVRAFVGVTDGDWYRFLATRPDLNEVNFWRPSSDREFRALAARRAVLTSRRTTWTATRSWAAASTAVSLPFACLQAWELFGNREWSRRASADLRTRVSALPPGADLRPMRTRRLALFIRDTKFFRPASGRRAAAASSPQMSCKAGATTSATSRTIDTYFSDLLQRLLGVRDRTRPRRTMASARTGVRRCGSRPDGWANSPSKPSFSARTASDAPNRREDSASASSSPHQTNLVWRRAPDRQRTAPAVRRTHTVRSRLPWIDSKHRLLVSRRLRADFDNGEQFYHATRRADSGSRAPHRPAQPRIPRMAPRRGLPPHPESLHASRQTNVGPPGNVLEFRRMPAAQAGCSANAGCTTVTARPACPILSNRTRRPCRTTRPSVARSTAPAGCGAVMHPAPSELLPVVSREPSPSLPRLARGSARGLGFVASADPACISQLDNPIVFATHV